MAVTSVDKDFDNLTLILVSEFSAPVERVWDLWADPRKLEQWWGPPGFPATFEEHNLEPGGKVVYYMTSPDGDKYRGWWEVTAANPPTSLEFNDGFADQDGNPNPDLPSNRAVVTFSAQEGGTRMEIRSIFNDRDHMNTVLEMGAAEGMEASLGQMDALLAA